MESDDPGGEGAVAHLAEAARLEALREAARRGKAAHARGQVGVRRTAGENLAEERDDAVEPDAVERREPPGRRRDLEDPEPPALPQHAAELAQAGVEILDVSDAEADRRRVEGRVAEGQG